MDGLTKSLAKEFGPSNVRVNSIAPGIINTEMNNSLSDFEKESLINEIPLGKIGSTKDIAKCVIDLYNSPYITGQVIQINGGWNV
jgi:3-oxoacyl-[acyl-carrier protein] reductase